MRPHVVLHNAEGESWELGHGDLIGRLWSAALCLADPRISEAHAMVSLRGQSLRLLALRGRFALDGSALTELELRTGQQIALADGLVLGVADVVMPDRVLALAWPGMPAQVVPGICALYGGSRPRLAPGFAPDADAWVWSDGDSWQWRTNGKNGPATTSAVTPGGILQVGEVAFAAVTLDVAQSAAGRTVADQAWQPPLRLVAHYDTVHILQEGRLVVALEGVSARLISELVVLAGPVHWHVLAGEVWRDESDRLKLRRRMDVALTRLRQQLREARVRTDLLRSTGTGHLELLLHDRDEAVDAT